MNSKPSLKREGIKYIQNYGWFELLYGRNQHNIVKQLSPKLKSLGVLNVKVCVESGLL